MNFIEVIKYLKEDSSNVAYHECWFSGSRNWITHYLVTKNKVDVEMVSVDTGNAKPFSTMLMMLDDRWFKDKKDNVIPRRHTFEEALKALKEGKSIKRKSSAAVYEHTVGANSIYPYQAGQYDGSRWVDISFTNDDILANDWIIIDKE